MEIRRRRGFPARTRRRARRHPVYPDTPPHSYAERGAAKEEYPESSDIHDDWTGDGDFADPSGRWGRRETPAGAAATGAVRDLPAVDDNMTEVVMYAPCSPESRGKSPAGRFRRTSDSVLPRGPAVGNIRKLGACLSLIGGAPPDSSK